MPWVRGLGDGEDRRPAQEEAEGDLPGRGMVSGGDLREHAAVLRARAGKASRPEGAIGDHGDIVPLAPRDDLVLDGALAKMVEHLIAGEAATRACDVPDGLEVGHIE